MYIKALIDSNIYPIIVELCKSGQYNTKKEALWVIANTISGGNKEQIEYLNKLNVLEVISINLANSDDQKIIDLCLTPLKELINMSTESNRIKFVKESDCKLFKINLFQEFIFNLEKKLFLSNRYPGKASQFKLR